MNVYIRRLTLAAVIVSSTVPAHAGWASDIGSYVSSTVSGWFSQPSNTTNVVMAVMGAAAAGLSAYLIYTLWKKQNGARRPHDPNPRPEPVVPPLPHIPDQPPSVIVEPVPRAPELPALYQFLPVIAGPTPEEREYLERERKRAQPEIGNAAALSVAHVGHVVPPIASDEIQRREVPYPVAYRARIVQPAPKESRVEAPVVTPTVSCPAPQPYLSWEDQRRQGIRQQTPAVNLSDDSALQIESKVTAAQHQAALTASQEWDNVSHDDALPESPRDLVEQEKDLIERGRSIKRMICNGEKNELTKDETRAVIWYLWKSVPSGISELTFKIEDTPDRRLLNALLTCKDEHGKSVVYPRKSSHFPNQVEGGQHYGIDIEGLPLPEKTTIVFAPLTTPDELHRELGEKTLFYIKPEDHGCADILSMASHGWQYVQSQIGSRYWPDWHDRPEYAKERTPYKIAQAWRACLDHVDCDAATKAEFEKFADLQAGGVYKMLYVRGVLQAKKGKETDLAQGLNQFEKVLDETYPGDQLKYAHMRNGREIFVPLTRLRKKTVRPMFVDLEEGSESESPSPRTPQELSSQLPSLAIAAN